MKNNFDIIIIGAGPAGLMAAASASSLGVRVLIIEKNKQAGIKLLMTGGGRCNLSNNISDVRELAKNYEPFSPFLFSVFSRFGPSETIDFFKSIGLALKEERGGRVFPLSDRADDVLNSLLTYNKNLGVILKTSSSLKKINFDKEAKKILNIELADGEILNAKKYILACGGKSYPFSGSSGEVYDFLRDMGHKINRPRPALSPLLVKDSFIKSLSGLSLKNIELSLFSDNLKIASEKSDLLFTDKSLSGPAALNLSRLLDLKKHKNIRVSLDLFPDISKENLEIEIQKACHAGKKELKNVMRLFLPPKLNDFIFDYLKIDDSQMANSLKVQDRKKIVNFLKSFDFSLKKEEDFNQAMITAGGLDVGNLNPKNFRSNLFENLYVIGESLDLSGRSGGFNLQLAWSSGYLTGEDAALSL